jgi:hypothetical protein
VLAGTILSIGSVILMPPSPDRSDLDVWALRLYIEAIVANALAGAFRGGSGE